MSDRAFWLSALGSFACSLLGVYAAWRGGSFGWAIANSFTAGSMATLMFWRGSYVSWLRRLEDWRALAERALLDLAELKARRGEDSDLH